MFKGIRTKKSMNGTTVVPCELVAIKKLLTYALGSEITLEEYTRREEGSTYKIYEGEQCIGIYNGKLQLFDPRKMKDVFDRLAV